MVLDSPELLRFLWVLRWASWLLEAGGPGEGGAGVRLEPGGAALPGPEGAEPWGGSPGGHTVTEGDGRLSFHDTLPGCHTHTHTLTLQCGRSIW